MPKPTPRVFIIRHGETEWSLNGRHTGTTELELTENGERRIRATGEGMVGDDRLIVPRNLAHIYVSPRRRAQRTLELLGLGCKNPYPWQSSDSSTSTSSSTTCEPSTRSHSTSARIEITPAIAEWDYGAYEGLTSSQIREQRSRQPEYADAPTWDIWRDGCPGGESPAQITERLDGLVREIRERWHAPAMSGGDGKEGNTEDDDAQPCDVLIVAHGHILRALAARWVGRHVSENPSLILEAGGVGTLSYEHNRVEEPAILLGGAFVVELAAGAKP